MSDTLIIVPYRNRAAHLAQFLSHMAKYFSHIPVCIIEQYEHKPFNRAKLLNIGYMENRTNNYYRSYAMHDVDMLPGINVDYSRSPFYMGVTQKVKSEIQLTDYLGGVTIFSHEAFYKSGGYNNEYFHRAEDNEMMFNLKRLNIEVRNEFQEFTTLPHERKGPEFDPALWHKAQQKRAVQNQLTKQTCLYVVLDEKVFGSVRHLVVAI
jgi:beta-1,4-galactosyltransferase 4